MTEHEKKIKRTVFMLMFEHYVIPVMRRFWGYK